jgi:SAM-dependent methyltransferase
LNRREAIPALLALSVAGCSGLGVPEPPAEAETPAGVFFAAGVPYVPTRPEVLDAMLSLGEIGPTDQVYDLGCGDGRIVLAAARRFGARGMGVDLDPDLIARAQAEAQWQGLTERVRFATLDLFGLDLRPATVVMLYLSVEVNLKLRPKLLAEMRPGSRIVSNRFDMSTVWRPERSITASGTPVHLWRVPRAA